MYSQIVNENRETKFGLRISSENQYPISVSIKRQQIISLSSLV